MKSAKLFGLAAWRIRWMVRVRVSGAEAQRVAIRTTALVRRASATLQ